MIHDTDIYSQPEPEPPSQATGNRDTGSLSVTVTVTVNTLASSSSCVKLAWNAMYQVTHGATAIASEWPGPFPNVNLENVY